MARTAHRYEGFTISQPNRQTTVASPFADARHLYLLGVGIVLGILLGPAVLGRIAPGSYDTWFVGNGEAATALRAFDDHTRDGVERLIATGVTGIAVGEYLDHRVAERQALPAFHQAALDRSDHTQAMAGRLMALVLAVVLMMGIEAWAGPTLSGNREDGAVVSTALGRLVTIRYALIALWITLALAEPTALLRVPWLFVAALAVVALVVGFMPLGKKRV